MDKKLYDLSLRVLIYKEDGLFLARCLEMDLLGTGDSEKAAAEALFEMVNEHISFAVFKQDDGLLMFQSEKEYFERWEKAHQSKLREELFPDRAIMANGKAVWIILTKEDIGKLKNTHRRFNQIPESAIA